ncbi:MAG: DUF3185 family protein [Cyclobacteriaceae bacterium]|nr:DUF3185 family protein [Cyclobacteriaceae bacterium]
MKKLIGILLIVASVMLGYFGIQKYEESSKSVSIGSLELKASNEEERQNAFLMMGGGFILFAVGLYALAKK